MAGNLLRRLAAAAVLCTATIAIATAARGVRPGPPPLSAYGSAFYQLGHDHLNLRTKSGFTNSARYFLAVTRSDPASPLGYAGLAAAYALMPGYGVSVPPPRVAMRRAWAYAHVALVRDDASSEAHAALGYLQHQSGKRSDAGELELERAVALDPRNASAHVWLGGVLYERGLTARARKEFETAETLEPASPAAESWLASVLFLSREYAAAAEHLRRALDVDPSREDALKQLGTVAAQLGDSRLLLSALGRLQNACHCTAYVTIIRAYAYAKMHHAAAARVALAAALREAPPGKLTADVAFVYAALGDRRRAVAWLRRAQRDEPSEVALLARDPRLDPLRHDVDFQRWTRAARADT